MSLDKLEKSPREIFHPEIQKGSVNFKFGVLYAKDGQLTDDEMFSHDHSLLQHHLMGHLAAVLKGWVTRIVNPGEFASLLSPERAGKDSRILVFRLSAVQEDTETEKIIRSKYDCRGNKLERTKGCHLYAIHTHHGSELRIVAAVGNKLLLITKKQNSDDTSISTSLLSSPESPAEEFQPSRVRVTRFPIL